MISIDFNGPSVISHTPIYSLPNRLAGGQLLRVATIRRNTDTHYRHIHFHFSQKYLLFKFRCIIFIGVRIIKEKPGSVAVFPSLKACGLSEQFQQRIRWMYDNATSSVQINGFRYILIPIRSTA
jgi:hypothetical protein